MLATGFLVFLELGGSRVPSTSGRPGNITLKRLLLNGRGSIFWGLVEMHTENLAPGVYSAKGAVGTRHLRDPPLKVPGEAGIGT